MYFVKYTTQVIVHKFFFLNGKIKKSRASIRVPCFAVKSTLTYLYSAMMPGTMSGVRRP